MQFSGVTFSGGGFTVTPPPVTPPPLGPAAPTGLSATIGNTQLSIAFTPGSDNGNPITNYKYSLDGVNYTALSPADTTSPVTITGLTNGTAYTVYLKAVNAVGDSPASASTSGTPATTPAAPTGLSATAGDTQLSVAFTPGSDGGNAITNYKYSLDGVNYTALSPADATSPVVITGLTNGVTYTVYLKAVNDVGDSPASASTSGTPATGLSGPALFTLSGDEQSNGTVYPGSRSNRMTYDNTRSYNSSQSMKLQLDQGEPPATCGGNHFFGGRFVLPTLIPEGYNIWYRARFYFPSTLPLGYNFGTSDSAEATTCGKSADGPGFFKFLVLAPDTGTARLYVMPPMQRRGFGLTAGNLHVNSEAQNTGDSTYSWTVPRDQWFSLQVQVKVSSAATGGGFMRVWIDDQFILQHDKATIANSAYKIEEWGIGDYWNGVPWTDGQLSTTDSFWMDDVIIATDYPGYGAPNTVDSGGRPYISNATTVNNI